MISAVMMLGCTLPLLEPDVERLLRRVVRERGDSFKKVLNAAVREGLSGSRRRTTKRFRQKAFSMGRSVSGANLVKALSLAAKLEDEEVVRKLELGK